MARRWPVVLDLFGALLVCACLAMSYAVGWAEAATIGGKPPRLTQLSGGEHGSQFTIASDGEEWIVRDETANRLTIKAPCTAIPGENAARCPPLRKCPANEDCAPYGASRQPIAMGIVLAGYGNSVRTSGDLHGWHLLIVVGEQSEVDVRDGARDEVHCEDRTSGVPFAAAPGSSDTTVSADS